MDPQMADIVTVHLAASEASPDDDVVPRTVTVAGITEGLEFGERGLAGRVSLLSALEDLKGEHLIEERKRPVVDLQGERTAYFLTDSGRERAREVRETYRDRTVEVRNGGTEEVPLADIDEYLPPPALSRALARVTDDGVLYLHGPGEGFVNRTAELETFEDVLEADEGARGVLVSGEAGIGKTTLVTDEVADRARDQGYRVQVGGCRADAHEPYAPFREILSALEDGEDVLESGGAGSEVPGTEQYDAHRRTMFDAVADRLTEVATGVPLYVVVEDLHLAGEPTVALLGHLVTAVEAPIVLVGTYRPEDLSEDHPVRGLVTAWGEEDGKASTRHLPLERFGESETRRLIEWLVEHSDVPGAFAELVYTRTGGNPLFVEETVTRLLATGAADPRHDVFPTDPGELPLPETVEEAVDLRLEVLDEDTDAVLDVAAVIGQTVPFDVLAAAVELAPSDLRTHLDLLVDARFFERTDDEGLRFVSGLVRETCVDRIDEQRRRTVHERVADAYDELRGDDPDHHAAVAHHRAAAGDHDDAFEAYRKAGQRAIDVYAAETAAESYQSAFQLATDELDRPDDDEDVLEVVEQIAYARQLLDDYGAADRHLQYVADRTDDADRRRSVARARALMWRERGRYQRAIDIVEETIDDVGVEETEASVFLLDVKGFIHNKREEYDAAEEAYERGIALAAELGDEDLQTRMRRSKKTMAIDRETVDEEVLEIQEDSLAEAREEGDERAIAIETLNLALAAQSYGDLERAEETAREAIEMFQDQGTEMTTCDARNTLGVILQQAGKWEAAREQFETALETAVRVENERIETYTHTNLAELLTVRGELEAAVDHVERGLALAEDLDNPHYWTGLAITRALLAIERDEHGTAEEMARRGLSTATDVGIDSIRLAALDALGDAQRVAGDPDAAIETYREGLTQLDEIPPPGAGAEASLHVGLARSLLSSGDHEAALDHVEDARTASEDDDDADARIRACLAEGACHRERGEFEAADRALRRATERAATDGWRLLEWRSDYERALLERRRGNPDGARDRFEAIARIAGTYGATRLERQCREALEDA